MEEDDQVNSGQEALEDEEVEAEFEARWSEQADMAATEGAKSVQTLQENK